MGKKKKKKRPIRVAPDAPKQASSPSAPSTRWWIWLALPALAVGVYANSLSFEFVWDDWPLIVEDYAIKSFSYLHEFLLHDFFHNRESDLAYGYYRPVVKLSYVFDYALWNDNPLGFHLTNVSLHAMATVLVFALVRRLSSRFWVAAISGVLFAVHPIHSENVAWVAGRTDVLAFVPVIASMLCHLSAGNGTSRGSGAYWLYGVAGGLFALALLAKEMAAVLIPWVVIIEWIWRNQSWRVVARRTAPYLVVIGLYFIWRFTVIDVGLPLIPADVGAGAIVASAPMTLARYLLWLIFPVGQSAYVHNPYVTGPADIRFWAGVVAVGALIAVLVRKRHSHPTIVAAGGLLLTSFIPLLNFVRVAGPEDMGAVMAERFCYFPSLWCVVLVVLLLDRGRLEIGNPRTAAIAVGGVAVAISLVLSIATVRRNRVWQSDETLYRETLKQVPTAPLILSNLAKHYIREKQWSQADQLLRRAEKQYPKAVLILRARILWLVAQKQFAEAIPLQLSISEQTKKGQAVAQNNLAYLLRQNGEMDRSRAIIDQLIESGQAYSDVYVNLAEAERARGRTDSALDAYQRALSLRPDAFSIANALGSLAMKSGDLDRAEAVFREQLRFHGKNPGLLNNLALLYKKKGNLEQALAHFASALEHQPDHPGTRLNYANTLRQSGDLARAKQQYREVIRLAPSSPQAKVAQSALKGR